MRRRWSLAIVGVILILAGGVLAYLTQTSGGIRIVDWRFAGSTGDTMSALAYEVCVEDEPRCGACPLCPHCPTGQEARSTVAAGHRVKPR